MLQSALSPYIASSFREELERRLDELVPRLLNILDCNHSNHSYSMFCDYCKRNGPEESAKPCKYLLVKPSNLLRIFKIEESVARAERNLLSLENLLDTKSQIHQMSCRDFMKTYRRACRDIDMMLDRPEYSTLVPREYRNYLKSSGIASRKHFRIGLHIAKGSTVNSFLNDKRFRRRATSIFPEDKPLSKEEFVETSGKNLLRIANANAGFSSKIRGWLKEDPRLKEVEELARTLFTVLKDQPLKRKRKDGITYFTKLELNVKREKMGARTVRKEVVTAEPPLSAFNVSNLRQRYMSLRKRSKNLKNMVDVLNRKLRKIGDDMKLVGKVVELGGRDPIDVIKSVSRYYEMKGILRKMASEIKAEKRILNSPGPTKYRYQELIPVRDWLFNVDPNGIERNGERAWKILQVLVNKNRKLSKIDKELNSDIFRTFRS